MKQLNSQQASAYAALARQQQIWEPIKSHLESELETLTETLVMCSDSAKVPMLQGRIRAIKDIFAVVADAEAITSRRG